MKTAIVVLASLLLTASLLAASVNSYKATKVSNTTVLVSCQDEHEPIVQHLSNTTALVITCRKVE